MRTTVQLEVLATRDCEHAAVRALDADKNISLEPRPNTDGGGKWELICFSTSGRQISGNVSNPRLGKNNLFATR